MNHPPRIRHLAEPGRRNIVVGGLGGLLLGGLAIRSVADVVDTRGTPPAWAVPSNYFGMHIHHADTKTPWPSVPFGSWRLWDAYTTWPYLEPKQGQWDFRRLDTCVALAEKVGVSVLLPLGQSPAWASARPSEPSSYGPGFAAEPLKMEDWRNYVRKVFERYKGRIAHYEVWNEVNIKGFFSGTQATLVELVRIAYEEMKVVDPAAQMVSPSGVGVGRHLQWLDQYLKLGGSNFADIVGYHFYTPKESPEAMLPIIREVKEIARSHGLEDKPLWNTESGWWIENLSPTPRIGAAGGDWLKLNQELSQAYVARALILNWAFGVTRFYWYAWDNLDMGLWDAAAGRPKAAMAAYSRVAGWLTNRIVRECRQVTGVWLCTLFDKDGAPFRIVWRSNEAGWWSVPEQWSVTQLETLQGETMAAKDSIYVDGSPVLLR